MIPFMRIIRFAIARQGKSLQERVYIIYTYTAASMGGEGG
jgi:hypothetical protein